MDEIAKGWTCECGKEHKFGSYVYAHWDMTLLHTCEFCQRKHEVIQGEVTLVPEEPVKKARKKI